MSKRQRTSVSTALFASAVALALTATACGTAEKTAGGGEGKPVKLGLALSTLNNPFFVEMKKGAEEEAKAQGAEVTVQDAQDDASQQTNQVQNFLSQNMKAVIVNPVDSDAAVPAVKASGRAGVPVVAVDRSVSGGKVETTVASDNVGGGRMAAKQTAKELGGQGTILVLRGTPGTSASQERGKGFSEGLEQYPGIKVAARQSANFDRAKALDVTTNVLQANPDVQAVFAENDEMALGAAKALGSRAGKSVQVIGFDGTPEALKAVKKGTLNSTIAQQPAELGKMAVRNAVRVTNDGKVESTIKVPVKVVTEKNAGEFS